MKTKERFKAVQAAIAAIEKQFGKGAIMPLDGTKTQDIEVIPTGSLSLDLALGVGGLPRGRVVEIFGPESSGKTTLTLHAIAEAQRLGGICAFIDAEHALDPPYARRLGVRARGALRLAARQRRAGARDRRPAHALGRDRSHRRRLGRGADAEGGDRGRHGRRAHGPAGAPHEPGAAQAHRGRATSRTRRSSSSTSCDRRSASSSAIPRRPPAATRSSSTRRCGSTSAHRAAIKKDDEAIGTRVAREGREEQVRAAVPPGRVRRAVRHGHQRDGRGHRSRRRRTGSSRSRAPSFALDGERIGQGRDNACAFLAREPGDRASRCATGCSRR